MNIGMFIPIMLGGILMRKWGLQKPLVIAAALTMLISAILFVSPTLTLFSFAVAGIGACGGIFMTIGSYLVVRINPDEKSRSSSLIFTDFFFSLAGATLSFLLAWLFRMGASWIAMYGIMGGLGALMLALTIRCRFPSTEAPVAQQHSSTAARRCAVHHGLLGSESYRPIPQSVHREVDEAAHLPAGLHRYWSYRHCTDC